eukprot:scaffold29351_cov52-Attheya_sp.AAC.2
MGAAGEGIEAPKVTDESGELVQQRFLQFLSSFCEQIQNEEEEGTTNLLYPYVEQAHHMARWQHSQRKGATDDDDQNHPTALSSFSNTLFLDYKEVMQEDMELADAIETDYCRFEPFLHKAIQAFFVLELHPELVDPSNTSVATMNYFLAVLHPPHSPPHPRLTHRPHRLLVCRLWHCHSHHRSPPRATLGLLSLLQVRTARGAHPTAIPLDLHAPHDLPQPPLHQKTVASAVCAGLAMANGNKKSTTASLLFGSQTLENHEPTAEEVVMDMSPDERQEIREMRSTPNLYEQLARSIARPNDGVCLVRLECDDPIATSSGTSLVLVERGARRSYRHTRQSTAPISAARRQGKQLDRLMLMASFSRSPQVPSSSSVRRAPLERGRSSPLRNLDAELRGSRKRQRDDVSAVRPYSTY